MVFKRDSFWWKIIQQKYQLMSHKGLDQCNNISGLSFRLKDLCNPYLSRKWCDQFNVKGFKWILGKGDMILFWKDLWIGDQVLSEKFPRLYSISNWKQCTVKMVLEEWSISSSMRWTRELRVWEQQLEFVLDTIIREVVLSLRKDIVIWKHSGNIFH